MKLLKWVWAAYSFQFGGWDYRKHQCEHLRPDRHGSYICCTRMKHHPGKCNHTEQAK